jgi:hypothetical protein
MRQILGLLVGYMLYTIKNGFDGFRERGGGTKAQDARVDCRRGQRRCRLGICRLEAASYAVAIVGM